MTIRIRNVWEIVNTVLTIMNIILFGILTFNPIHFKEIRDKKIPIIANIGLLIFLGLGLFAALYK